MPQTAQNSISNGQRDSQGASEVQARPAAMAMETMPVSTEPLTPVKEVTPSTDISSGSRLFFGGMGESDAGGTNPVSPSSSGGTTGSQTNSQTAVPPAQSVYVTTPALEAQRQNGEAFTLVPESEYTSEFTWMGYFKGLGFVLGALILLWLGLRALRRFGKGRFLPAQTISGEELFLEAQLPLGQNKSVAVVRFQERRLVLGVTDQQITMLTETYISGDDVDDTDFQNIMGGNSQESK